MGNKWYEIWNTEDRINRIILEVLVKADGFDSGAGEYWVNYTGIEGFVAKINPENVGLYDLKEEHLINVYPVPAHSHLYVSLSENNTSKFKIFNISGKLVLNGQLESFKPIELGNLNSGMYILEVESNNQKIRKRFIIQ